MNARIYNSRGFRCCTNQNERRTDRDDDQALHGRRPGQVMFTIAATLKGTKDCVRQALAAGIPVWLTEDDRANPRRVEVGDKRLE
jgi:hypothetical protein